MATLSFSQLNCLQKRKHITGWEFFLWSTTYRFVTDYLVQHLPNGFLGLLLRSLWFDFFYFEYHSRKSRTARLNRRRRRSEERKARTEAKKKSKESKQVHGGAESHNRNDTNSLEPLSSDSGTDISSDSDEALDGYDDYTLYDPEIITQKDVAWASVLQCIGFNEDASGPSKAFISGLGEAEDYGRVDVNAGDDPNFPDEIEAGCFEDHNGLDPIFPFHVTCFHLFKKQFLHEMRKTYKTIKVEAIKDVSHDILYDVMLQLGHGKRSCLGIDYGPPAPHCNEQFWVASPGEELFVADPMKRDPLVTASILDAWENCSLPISVHDQGHGAGRDVFSKLPMELFINITTKLNPTELQNLIFSSRHVYDITAGVHNTRFWLQHFQNLMPWFFELNEFLEDTQIQGDLKQSLYRLFVWADQKTTPHTGKTGPFMGVANRRRIWGACQQVSRAYIADSTEEELFEIDILQTSSSEGE